MAPADPDRHEPLPPVPALPVWLWRRLGRRGRWAALGTLVAAVLAAALLVPAARREAREDARRADAAARQAAAVRRARIAREARPVAGRGPAAAGLAGDDVVAARRRLVAALEDDVLADARRRATRRDRGRPFRSAVCFEFPKRLDVPPPAENLELERTRMECIAVTSVIDPDERTTGSLIGRPYRAVVDFPRGRYTFCRIIQRPGELGIQRRTTLTVSPACGGGEA